MYFYVISLGAVLLCAIISGAASAKVHSAYNKYGKVKTKSRMTGYDTAQRLLRRKGVDDISVRRVSGHLTDHYHPTKKVVNLSDSTYGDTSVASVAVAAHEIGHVMQKKSGYIPYKIRTALVPITNIGSRLALPLVLIGVIIDLYVGANSNSNAGYYTALVGVVMYGLSTLFMLATLPVEFDASRRAKQMLLAEGILTQDELPQADKMLSAAAQTYVAALLTSLIYFLRFFLWVMVMFSHRRRD